MVIIAAFLFHAFLPFLPLFCFPASRRNCTNKAFQLVELWFWVEATRYDTLTAKAIFHSFSAKALGRSFHLWTYGQLTLRFELTEQGPILTSFLVSRSSFKSENNWGLWFYDPTKNQTYLEEREILFPSYKSFFCAACAALLYKDDQRMWCSSMLSFRYVFKSEAPIRLVLCRHWP